MQGSIEKVMYSSVPLLDELIRTVCTSQLSSGANGPGNQVEHEGLGAKFVALERLASQQAQGWPRLFGERLPLTIARVKEGELLSKRVGERVALRIQPNEVASCRVHTHDAPGTIYLDQPVGHGAKNRLQFDRGASSILVLVILEDVKIVRISLVRRLVTHMMHGNPSLLSYRMAQRAGRDRGQRAGAWQRKPRCHRDNGRHWPQHARSPPSADAQGSAVPGNE